MMTMKANTKVALGSTAFAIFGMFFLFTTDPQELSPILLIVPFVLFFLSLFLAVVFITTVMVKEATPSLSRKSFMFSLVLAAYPVMLLLLQSIGQLSLRDVVTLTLLLVISGFYIARSSFGT
jgi:hypothetical protein